MKPVSMIIRSFAAILFAASATSAFAITGAWTGAISDGTHTPQVVTYRFSQAGNPRYGWVRSSCVWTKRNTCGPADCAQAWRPCGDRLA